MIALALAAQTKAEIARKTQLLLQIASSGLKVEEVMEEHASELDLSCVRLMEKRIEAAYKQGPSTLPRMLSISPGILHCTCNILADSAAS